MSGLDLTGVYLPNPATHEVPIRRDVPGPAEFPKNFHVLLSFGGKKRGRLYLTVNIKDLTQDRPLFSSVVTVLPCRDSSQMLTVIRVLFSICSQDLRLLRLRDRKEPVVDRRTYHS